MDFITWIQTNGTTLLTAIVGAMGAAGAIVGLFNGPKAAKAKGIIERVIALLRGFGIGTYKDEPGTLSVPFKGDSGERVVTTTKAG